MRRMPLGHVVTVAGCTYEIWSILSGRGPTITRAIKMVGAAHPAGKLLVWTWAGYVAWHFLEPDSL